MDQLDVNKEKQKINLPGMRNLKAFKGETIL